MRIGYETLETKPPHKLLSASHRITSKHSVPVKRSRKMVSRRCDCGVHDKDLEFKQGRRVLLV